MAAADLAHIPDVDIDSDGVFKYVLIRVHSAPRSGAPAAESKEIVRGYKWAEYHADIYDKVSGDMQKQGCDCECLGGGRISHQSQDKKIHVYGYSMHFGPWAPRGSQYLGGAQSPRLCSSQKPPADETLVRPSGRLRPQDPPSRPMVLPSTPFQLRKSKPSTLTTRSPGLTTATEHSQPGACCLQQPLQSPRLCLHSSCRAGPACSCGSLW
ncbi:14 kDa phosphohistidine phosphatase isoform X1 [Gorilla gorilla gorilla]|uniref:14 kDa phosphohistidine phosphatase isoform X1 n=1 Tax=Gorilla gorilla gorilla TaxID=9595 RepID=UPI00300A6C67